MAISVAALMHFYPAGELDVQADRVKRLKTHVPSSLDDKTWPKLQRLSQSGAELSGEPLFLCHRPASAAGLPAALLSPVFGQFSDFAAQKPTAGWEPVSTADCNFVRELCSCSLKVYQSKVNRRDVVQQLFETNLQASCAPYNNFEGNMPCLEHICKAMHLILWQYCR